jgi:hypothetical protein
MRQLLPPVIVALGLCAPAAAGAGAFPIGNVDTSRTGATVPGGPYRYVVFPGAHDTLLVKIGRDGGSPLASRRLRGALVVAAVAQDASTTGLSADGSTLVLAARGHRIGAATTRLTVVDAPTLRPRRVVRLHGDFALDGISPDGRRLYLVEYRLGSPTDYAVRAYDLPHRRLLARHVADPRNPGEKMTGFPLTRSMSADGRWAYTLYAGGDEPFVHALDTARGQAFCVDVTGLLPDDLATMRLVARPGHIDLVGAGGAVVRRIDASTFRVTTPPPVAAPSPARARGRAPSEGFPWALAGAVGAFATVALLVLRRRYAAGTDSATSRSASSSSPTVP